MAGTFSKTSRPIQPGSYTNFAPAEGDEPNPSIGGTVLVTGKAPWGPANVPVLVESAGEAANILGTDSPLMRGIRRAFRGRGLPGKGGASAVMFVREVGASGAPSTVTLTNTGNAAALVLTARYDGTAGDEFRFTLQHTADAGTDELVVLRGSREVESFVAPNTGSTQLAALAAQINATSGFWTAAVTTDGTALKPVVAAPATGGDDGTSFTAAELTAQLAALEFEPFSVFAPANLTDAAAQALIVGWMQEVRERGKRMTIVFGGPLGEAFTAHRSRTLTYNDPDVVSFGTGSIDDDLDTNPDGSTAVISTAEGAPRYAGDIAASGNRRDIINSRYLGWTVRGGVTRAQADLAAKQGMSVLTRDGHPTAPTRINEGVTSYTSDTATRPNRIFARIKFVRTMQLLQQAITEEQEYGDLISEAGVTDKTPDLVIGGVSEILNDLVEAQVILPGYTLGLDNDPPPTALDDFVQIKYGIAFVRGLRQVFNTVTVS
jgi:hypothetical protein